MDVPQWKACEDAVYGLTQLATGYGLLFDFLEPGRTGHTGIRAPGPRPPASPHVIDAITKVEQDAYWVDGQICYWLTEERTRFPVWHDGTPNPEVALLLAESSRRLPEAAEWAGDYVYEIRDTVAGSMTAARSVLGEMDHAELAGLCPKCHETTLVRLHRRLLCALPDCFDERREQ